MQYMGVNDSGTLLKRGAFLVPLISVQYTFFLNTGIKEKLLLRRMEKQWMTRDHVKSNLFSKSMYCGIFYSQLGML